LDASRAAGNSIPVAPKDVRFGTCRNQTTSTDPNPRGLRGSRELRISGPEGEPIDTPETVPASEFTRNFGRYRMRAQREAVAVSSHGRITGYFIGPDEYEEFRRFRESRRSFATAELPDEKVEAIRASRMDPRHAHLDAMLDRK
jgi:hypothetical protein